MSEHGSRRRAPVAVRKKGKDREILEWVRRTFLRHDMVVPGDTVVVGVSGGLDSVCLLDILTRLKAEDRLRLVIAHVHHGLRPEEGDREFRFVEGLASRYGVPFEGRRIEASSYAKGVNVQAQARRFRVRFFEDVAREWGAGRIATGHHRDDHAETLLMQVLRGTGGLIGIRPVRDGTYIRPLIEIPRERIRAYAKGLELPFCEDSSNRKRTYLRNRIRQDLIPWIRKEANPSFVDSLLQLASILEEETKCLDTFAEEALERVTLRSISEAEVILRRDLLEGMPRAIQRRVLRRSYGRLVGSTQGLSYVHLEGVCDALGKPEGRVHKVFSLPRGVRVFLEYETLSLTRRDLWEVTPYEVPLPLGDEMLIPEAGITLRAHRVVCDGSPPESVENRLSRGEKDRYCACLDADLAVGEMVVRNARPGDRFRPLGLGGGKKLKDFFRDEKIPRSLRHRIAILEIGGRVAWVVGYRVDDRFKVSEGTRDVICVHALATDHEEGTRTGKISQIK
jgi:tRNA(Ile)-lysidine synthase